MESTIQQIHTWFVKHDFHVTYQSTALYLLAHHEVPGIEVRIGTAYTVVERDGYEVYRTLHRDFDPVIAMERTFGSLP